jgi:hypothetical protein
MSDDDLYLCGQKDEGNNYIGHDDCDFSHEDDEGYTTQKSAQT